MNAIRVILGQSETLKMGEVVSVLNSDDEIAAMITGKNEFFIAVSGVCSLAYAKAVIAREFDEFIIETIK